MRTPAEAVAVALSLVGHGIYWLGTGDHNTPDDGKTDCVGFAVDKCYDQSRHVPGLNRGNPCGIDAWDVEDDINSNSMLADAHGARMLFRPLADDETPQEGDWLVYATARIHDAHGELHVFVGHCVIVVDASGWDGTYASLKIIQACGPDGRDPGIIAGSGSHFDDHDKVWPTMPYKTHVLRPASA